MTSIHHLAQAERVSRVADHVTVIRDGRTIETIARADLTEDRIITSMVGRALEDRYPPREPKIGDVVLEVRDWSVYHPIHPDRQVIKGIDLTCAPARSSASPA
jgi:putative multiple sugar transport system ATP-binding protein